jgi:hypothetical protein
VRDRIAPRGRTFKRTAIPDIAVDWSARKAAAAGGACEDDELVPARRKRPHDGTTEISGTARDKDFHGGIVFRWVWGLGAGM